MFNLEGKVALITGAKRGMGRSHALILSEQGAKVVVTDIDEKGCRKVVDEIEENGGDALCYKMDVSDSKEVDEVISSVVQEYGRLDILVNNAGIYKNKLSKDISEEEWSETIDINLKGQFLCAKKAAREMAKNNWGRIINISSIASGQQGIGLIGGVHYSSSKGGIIGMTESLARELADDGINVNAIAPGAIDTPMIRTGNSDSDSFTENVPLKRIGKPEEVSAAVVFLASEEASYITGSTVYVDGGWLTT